MRNTLVFFLLLLLSAPAHAATVADDTGRTLDFDAPFARIVSLWGAHTENLFSLGLEDEIVGVSRTEDYPSQALERPQFSVRDGVNAILEAAPDLVLMRPSQVRSNRSLRQALENNGVRVLAFEPSDVDAMYAYWRTLGLLTEREPQAEAMIARFREGLERARQRLERIPERDRPAVFFESIHRKFATFAPDSLPMFVLKTAGGRNIARNAQSRDGGVITPFGLERVLNRASAIDVYLAQRGPMNEVEVSDITGGPAASKIKAVREKAVFLVDERIVSRPTMRLLVGVDTIFRLLHPTSPTHKDRS